MNKLALACVVGLLAGLAAPAQAGSLPFGNFSGSSFDQHGLFDFTGGNNHQSDNGWRDLLGQDDRGGHFGDSQPNWPDGRQDHSSSFDLHGGSSDDRSSGDDCDNSNRNNNQSGSHHDDNGFSGGRNDDRDNSDRGCDNTYGRGDDFFDRCGDRDRDRDRDRCDKGWRDDSYDRDNSGCDNDYRDKDREHHKCHAVPLPPAAWMGLSSLALAVIPTLKRRAVMS